MWREKGQTLVEFALILPILLLVIFVIVESGRLFHAYITVQHAARVAARYAVTGQYDSNCTWWWNGGTPSDDELRACSVMAVAWSQTQALAVDPAATAWNDPGHLEIHIYSLRKDDPADSSTWYVDDPYAGEPNEKVVVQVSYRLEIITPFVRPIARSVPVSGQAEMINEAFGQLGGLGFQGVRVPPAPVDAPTPGPSPTSCPPITLTVSSLIENATSVLGNAGAEGIAVSVYDMDESAETPIGSDTAGVGGDFDIGVDTPLVAAHRIRVVNVCGDYVEGTVQGPTPTFTLTPTSTGTPTITPTPTPCPVDIIEPLVVSDTQVTVHGEVQEVGETVVIRDISQSGGPTLGSAMLTGEQGHCTGWATIAVDPPLISGHTIVAQDSRGSVDWAVVQGAVTPTPTLTHTPTITPTLADTATPTITPTPTPTPGDPYIVIEPTCGPAGTAQSIVVYGYNNWPTNKGSIRVRWDGVEPDLAIVDPPQPIWNRAINLSADDMTAGTHTVWAGVLHPPYTFYEKNFDAPCYVTPTSTPTATPTPLRPDLIIGHFESSGNRTWVPVVFTVRVDNIGTGGANSLFWVDLFVNPASPPSEGELGDAWRGVSSLAASESITLTFEYVFTATNVYPVYTYADIRDAINEDVEDNNLGGPLNVLVDQEGPTPTATLIPSPTPIGAPGSVDGFTRIGYPPDIQGRVDVYLMQGTTEVQHTVSNDVGYYNFPSVAPGTYTVYGETVIGSDTYWDSQSADVLSGENTRVNLILQSW